MHTLLLRLLQKRGITKDDLDKEEKQTFDNWERILSEGEISVEKIGEFCKMQIRMIETQWKNLDNKDEKNKRLMMLHIVYSSLLQLIEAPQTERENLEKYLTDLLTKPV